MIEKIISDPLFFGLFIGFSLVTLIQLIYFWGFFSRLAFYKARVQNTDLPPVSVVITANNQYSGLRDNLPAFLSQDYPDYEVVVVIDNSEDGSNELLQDLSRSYPNLSVVELTQSLNWFKGRKFPLSLGIKSAKNDIILLSDVQCRPESDKWLQGISEAYAPEKEIILSYTTFQTSSKVNVWLRFTAFYDALFYLSMGVSGLAFKGIGKNLSYTRSLFYKHKGFSSHYMISAGDDEIFVNKAANKSNVAVMISPDTVVKVLKKPSFLQWLHAERSRMKIRRFFHFTDRLRISMFSGSSVLFFAFFVSLLLLRAPLVAIFSIFAVRFLSQMVIYGFSMHKLSEKKLLLFSPLFEVFLLLIDFIIGITLLFTKKNKWT